MLVLTSGFLLGFWVVFVVGHAAFRKRSLKGTVSSFFDRLKGRDVQRGVAMAMEEMSQDLEAEEEYSEEALASDKQHEIREKHRLLREQMKEKYQDQKK